MRKRRDETRCLRPADLGIDAVAEAAERNRQREGWWPRLHRWLLGNLPRIFG